MITVGALVFVLLTALLIPPAGRVGSRWRFVVTRLCWIPVTLLALEYAASHAIAASLGYAGILIPLLTCCLSYILALPGARLLVAGHGSPERDRALLVATIVAGIPAMLLAVELARELIVGAVR